LPEAETEFKTALRLKPGDAEFEQTYAAVLADHGKPEEAIEHVEKALRIKADIESHLLLARLRYQRGDVQQAAEQYRLALNRNPDLVEALNNLAWIRSTSADRSVRDGVAAVQLAERACRLTGSTNAGMIGTLAAAYAEAGRFADAEASATKAADLATAAGDSRFAEMNRQLLQLYRSRRPYHEGGP
jgi:tetratricopeptide (TPR) repeat protein